MVNGDKREVYEFDCFWDSTAKSAMEHKKRLIKDDLCIFEDDALEDIKNAQIFYISMEARFNNFNSLAWFEIERKEVVFPWCETMKRAVKECNCPDCGSSLISYKD
jgi:hypothetical protein